MGHGRVQGAVNNFRFNGSPVRVLARAVGIGWPAVAPGVIGAWVRAPPSAGRRRRLWSGGPQSPGLAAGRSPRPPALPAAAGPGPDDAGPPASPTTAPHGHSPDAILQRWRRQDHPEGGRAQGLPRCPRGAGGWGGTPCGRSPAVRPLRVAARCRMDDSPRDGAAGPSRRGGPSVAVLGDINVDLILDIRDYPNPGGDGVARHQHTEVGGSATNTAIVLSRLGARVRLLGCVGRDHWGDELLRSLAAAGVDASRVPVDPAEPTSLNVVVVTPDGERTMFAYRGANRRLPVAAVTPEWLDGVGWLHLSGYAFLEAPQRDAAWAAVRHAHERGTPISLDVPTDPARRVPEELVRLLPWLALVVVGGEEARVLGAAATVEMGTRALLKRGCGLVAVKRGAAGCSLVDARSSINVPGFDAAATDTTGAGDAFCAGLVFGLLTSQELPSAGRLANALGALATTRTGAGMSLPGGAEAAELLASAGSWPVPGPGPGATASRLV